MDLFRNYDKWKTSGPDEYDDDEICANCQGPIDLELYHYWIDEGYCSKKCWDEDTLPVPGPIR